MNIKTYENKEQKTFFPEYDDYINFSFRKKAIKPTPKDGELPVETLYSHLITVITDKKNKKKRI